MRSRSRHVLHALLTAGALSLGSAEALAQPQPEDPKRTEEARSRFQRGVELYRDGDYRAAIIEFRRAYELVPNWRIQYNLAQACAEVQDYPCTLRALSAYLADGGGEVPADRRAAVDAELKRVTGRIARVTVKVNQPGAEVFADETSLGKSPLEAAALVSAGRRKLSATLPSGRTVAKIVEVAGGDEVTVALDFEALAPVSAPSPVSPDKSAAPAPSSTPFYIGLIATGVLAAGTATTGLLSLSAKSDLDSELDQIPGSEDAIASARSKTETLGLVTDVLGVATIVAAGVTLYLALSRPSKSVALTVGPRATGFVGRF